LGAREGVGDNVVLSGYVSDIGRELGYEVKMVNLPGRAFVPLLLEGVSAGIMVREDEVARFQHVAEMLHGLIDSQQLPI
jgi:hypothetical protein